MTQISPNSQVDVFRLIVEMEARGQQLDEILARLKQIFLQAAGSVSVPSAVGALDDLRWHLTQIAEQIVRVEGSLGVQRRPASRENRPPSTETVNQVRGTTRTVPVTDLMALLGAQRKTGTLRIKTDSGERFVLELLDGAVVHAAADSPLPNEKLGEILVAQHKISHDRLSDFLAQFCPGNTRLGAALAQAKLVSESDLVGALEVQIRKMIQRIADLQHATFCFTEGPVSNIELRVSMNTTHLLLEAAKAKDEESLRT